MLLLDLDLHLSHPTWVRGLKHDEYGLKDISDYVAPYVGAWIETRLLMIMNICQFSRTLRGCVD